jgi:putative transposase
MYERRDVEDARRDLRQWLEKWTFYRLPVAHHKHLKSTNLLEQFDQEIKRRTLVVRIFPDEASCLRLIRAVASEQHEEWMDGCRHLNAGLCANKSNR